MRGPRSGTKMRAGMAALTLLVACGREAPPSEPASPLWREGPRLPSPVSNNAVVAVAGPGGPSVLSLLGVDSTKAWSGATSAVYRWDPSREELAGSAPMSTGWRTIAPVPGPGRLAATAQRFGGRIFVFGGYTVAEDGTELSLPNVDVYNPQTDSWLRVADMPVPVDDAMSGVWASELVFLVSGWHDNENVADVQSFDPSLNRWTRATPIPGAPVFGHVGAIAGSDIVYVGGARVVDARPRFVMDSTAWRGRIDPTDPSVIDWEPIAPPPGPPAYRAAAGVIGGRVALLGGTDNPYNYDGVGYDGQPSEPVSRLVAFDRSAGWVELPAPPVATMDHRTLAVAGGWVFVVGGMTEGQRVSDRVWFASEDALTAVIEKQAGGVAR